MYIILMLGNYLNFTMVSVLLGTFLNWLNYWEQELRYYVTKESLADEELVITFTILGLFPKL